jgi:DNA-binding CsgD family transcriptional regulator
MPEQEGNIGIHLSPRRKEFCRLLVQLYKLEEISKIMRITFETARSMCRTIHDITGIRGHTNLICFLRDRPHLYAA